MQTMNRGGDVLARGGVRMDLAPGSNATQEQWDKAFGESEPVEKANYVFKCSVHGTLPVVVSSKTEFFLSGGYPQLDESKTSKCTEENCDEITTYNGYVAAK